MSEGQVRIGVIGAGGIGGVHAAAIAEAGNVVAGTCDVHRERAEALAEGYPGAAVFDDVQALLADESIPAVVVALPNCLHSCQRFGTCRCSTVMRFLVTVCKFINLLC